MNTNFGRQLLARSNRHVTRRTALKLTLLGSVSAVLAACGGSASSSPASSGGAAASSASSAGGGSASAAANTAGGSIEALAQAAKQEGSLTLYNSAAPDPIERAIQAFQSKYGLKIDHVRLPSGALTTRFANEAQAKKPVADALITSDTDFWGKAVQANWFAPIKDLPAAPAFPAQYKTDYLAMAAIAPITITYMSDRVKPEDAPKQWTDLLKPRFKDKILLVDPRGVAVWMAWSLLMRQTYGDDFLKNLGAQNPRLVESAIPGSQQLVAGEGDVLLPTAHWGLADLLAKGAKVADTAPGPSTGIEQQIAIPAGSPHPNAGRLFVNFMMTADSQSVLCKDACVSPLPNISGTMEVPAGYKSPDIATAVTQKDAIVKLLGLH